MENNLIQQIPAKKKSLLRTIFGWVVYLAILVGLVLGTPKALSMILHTNYPMASITSGSMWPVLKQGDMVLIKGVANKDEISVGDIVVYKNFPSTDSIGSPQAGSGQALGFTIHRVIKKNENTFVTKGDANNVSDAPVAYQELVGKTVNFRNSPLKIPYLGNISIMINSNHTNAASKD